MAKFVPVPNFDGLTPQTTKGDLIGRTTAGATRVPVGSDNTVLTADSSQALGVKWASAVANATVNTLTGATTLPATSQVVLASGTTFAITLPSPTSNSGLEYRIIKTDTGVVTPISISGTGFVGMTLQTQSEEVSVICDGATYWPYNHQTITDWSTALALTPGVGYGSIASSYYKSRRVGGNIEFSGQFQFGTVGASPAILALPTGIAVSTTFIPASLIKTNCGTWVNNALTTATAYTANNWMGPIGIDPSNTAVVYVAVQGLSASLKNSLVNDFFTSNQGLSFNFSIPVQGWKG